MGVFPGAGVVAGVDVEVVDAGSDAVVGAGVGGRLLAGVGLGTGGEDGVGHRALESAGAAWHVVAAVVAGTDASVAASFHVQLVFAETKPPKNMEKF